MEKEKLIRLALIVLGVIVILIIVENSIRGIGILIENKKENDIKKEQLESYQNSLEYKETVMLEEIINNVTQLLNNNDVDSLYNMLDLNYKDYKFQNNKELFENYIKQYVNNDSNITLQSYEYINGAYICRLLSDYNGNLKSFMILINKPENESDYTIIFDNITSIEKINKTIEQDGIKVEIMYLVTAKQQLIYETKFTNESGKDINYQIKDIWLKDTMQNKFMTDSQEINLALKPTEAVRYKIEFNEESILSFPKMMLNFILKDENGNEKEINFYVEDVI